MSVELGEGLRSCAVIGFRSFDIAPKRVTLREVRAQSHGSVATADGRVAERQYLGYELGFGSA